MKYISEFVKRQRELNARLVPKIFWKSSEWGTYVKAKNGQRVNKPKVRSKK